MTVAVQLIPYESRMGLTGKAPLVLLLVAFPVTFTLTRVYTRLACVRGWGSGSVGGMKGEAMLGMLSVFVPLVGMVGALRLARPHSLWATWLYAGRPTLGGAPTPLPAKEMRIVAGRLAVDGDGTTSGVARGTVGG